MPRNPPTPEQERPRRRPAPDGTAMTSPAPARPRSPRPALTRLVRGSIPDQVMSMASCPVLAIPLRQHDN